MVYIMLLLPDNNLVCTKLQPVGHRSSMTVAYICDNQKSNIMRHETSSFDYARFYEQNYESALRYARTFMHDDEDARDVVSDAMLRLLELSGRVDHERNVRGLFMSMVHNRCLDVLRRRRCYGGVEEELTRSASGISDDELTRLCQRELFRLVGAVIRRMPEKEQAVFVPIRFGGDSYKQVSERTGLSERSVEYNLKKATDRMRTCLAQMYG